MRYVQPEPNTGCWLWEGGDRGQGYGAFKIDTKRAISAHRASYQLHKGPIPDGLTIDHLCRVRCCVNPDHLEAVTAVVNVKRGEYRKGLALGGAANGRRQQARTHCKRGHEFTPENTGTQTSAKGTPSRYCKACKGNFANSREYPAN